MNHSIGVLTSICLFLAVNLYGQSPGDRELGISFKRVIPSAFKPTPDYDAATFPYVSNYQQNGRNFEIQVLYRQQIIGNWGASICLGGSLYSTGLSIHLPEDENPYSFGNGVYDFYNTLVGSRASASLAVDFTLRTRLFQVRPCISINLGSHLNEILRIEQGYTTGFPVGSSTTKSVFQVYLERRRFLEINPSVGMNLSVNRLSKLLNFILGIHYVHGNRESLFGYYRVDAVSGQYVGSLSNTEERLEFLLGVNLKMHRERAE